MRCVFLGTPDFAAVCLKALIRSDEYTVAAVFTQPDKRVGRKQVLTAPPVKELAKEYGISVYQPEKIKEQKWIDVLKEINPDIIITAAFGQILSAELLSIPKKGTVNVHGSLLPEYRGPAPIQWAIINGEKTTGVTTMFTDVGVDTGDMLLKAETEIKEDETSGELFDRLAQIGADLLIETLDKLDSITPVPQDDSKASYYPMLSKDISQIDFTKDAMDVHNHIRGLNPWPVAYFMLGDKKINVFRSQVCDDKGKPGEILCWDRKNGIVIGCGNDSIRIIKLQVAGKKQMDAASFINGNSAAVGDIL